MHQIITDIEIASTPAQIWSVLTDFESFPDWNPFIRAIQGSVAKGSRLSVSVQPSTGRTMAFKPRVLVADTNVELRWLGRLLVPGIFDGEHFFKILPGTSPGCTRFVQGEIFGGLLVRLMRHNLEGATKAGFVAMNAALKVRVEALWRAK